MYFVPKGRGVDGSLLGGEIFRDYAIMLTRLVLCRFGGYARGRLD